MRETFTLTGIALDPQGLVRLRMDHRTWKPEGGSQHVRYEWGDETWPNTHAGNRAGMERTGVLNQIVADGAR